jgi:hypothetical protein
LLQRWAKKAKWSEEIGERIQPGVKIINSDFSPAMTGACHCEAGLTASLPHSRLDAPSKDTTLKNDDSEEEKGQADGFPEPAVLSAIFVTQVSLYTVWHPFLTCLFKVQ